MNYVLNIKNITEAHRQEVGGKGYSLARLLKNGFNVPDALCVTTEAYRHFISKTGLSERVLMELNRKNIEDMRWEEIWDASHRIRALFNRMELPSDLSEILRQHLEGSFQDRPVVVRSSAVGEDSAEVSFAGLHESYVNVRGADNILQHIKLVWSSLWSDAAILYRREMNLDVEKSAMGVVIQELISGERSGIIFGMNPLNSSQAVIEAVYGLNQGLVDGRIEPDRWILDRKNGAVLTHTPARREKIMQPASRGIEMIEILEENALQPPLSQGAVKLLHELSQNAEMLFGSPQDIEWTMLSEDLYTLQSRPITTRPEKKQEKDERLWFLSLRRTFENLSELRSVIEDQLIPQMVRETDELAKQDLEALSDEKLVEELGRRNRIFQRWNKTYREQFIPYAHGMRLFGRIYNDAVHPKDPYEFVDLLRPDTMESLSRNRLLAEMALIIRGDTELYQLLKTGDWKGIKNEEFLHLLELFLKKYANLGYYSEEVEDSKLSLFRFLLELAATDREKAEIHQGAEEKRKVLLDKYLSCFPQEEERRYAEEILDLGRSSYRLRDDDNIYLGRVEGQMQRAVAVGRKRIGERGNTDAIEWDIEQVADGLKNPSFLPSKKTAKVATHQAGNQKPRQLVGQPAVQGVASGKARVILKQKDLFSFKKGEILVCDAIDPNMTFVVPLARGIVERRGGMLIHGAIIAREYGIPCVTGLPNVTTMIQNGDTLTVDGFLGIVVVQ
jgi:pyruvate,water dikinase